MFTKSDYLFILIRSQFLLSSALVYEEKEKEKKRQMKKSHDSEHRKGIIISGTFFFPSLKETKRKLDGWINKIRDPGSMWGEKNGLFLFEFSFGKWFGFENIIEIAAVDFYLNKSKVFETMPAEHHTRKLLSWHVNFLYTRMRLKVSMGKWDFRNLRFPWFGNRDRNYVSPRHESGNAMLIRF